MSGKYWGFQQTRISLLIYWLESNNTEQYKSSEWSALDFYFICIYFFAKPPISAPVFHYYLIIALHLPSPHYRALMWCRLSILVFVWYRYLVYYMSIYLVLVSALVWYGWRIPIPIFVLVSLWSFEKYLYQSRYES